MARVKASRTNNPRSTATAAEISLVPEVRSKLAPINLEDEIRRRAYELYERRGCNPGYENEDWLAAEQEVVARYSHSQSA